jgi:hypothetical protein
MPDSFNRLCHIHFTAESTKLGKPVLKWKYGDSYSSWCETGWYSTPAVADLDQDGENEIIAFAYSIVILDAKTGKLSQRIYSGHDKSK